MARQLAVYDFGSQPVSYGDFYVFLQASLTWSARSGAHDVDLCLVCNPADIRIPEFAALGRVEGALRAKVFELLPLAQMHGGIRHIFIVDHLERALELVQRAGSHYDSTWPPLDLLTSGQYLWYPSMIVFDRLYRGQRLTPRLRPRAPVALWARDFLAAHATARTAVTVNLRMNPDHDAHRNMHGMAWRSFFEQASIAHEAVFFLLGAATENFDLFRPCSNVVITKDWHTNIEQDFALIELAQMHLGSSSGPGMGAIFAETKPALIFNCDALPHIAHYDGALLWDGQALRYSFGNSLCHMVTVPESPGLLCEAFASLSGAIVRHSANG